MHDIHLPPPRYGDHSAVNRHLTAGGTVEGIPWGNPYLPYIKQLMEKNKHHLLGTIYGAGLFVETDNEEVVKKSVDLLERATKAVMLGYGDLVVFEAGDNNTLCGKPHNNGEDTCNECLTIKEGI